MENIILVGFKGSRKKEIGEELAKILDFEFIDIDNKIDSDFGLDKEQQVVLKEMALEELENLKGRDEIVCSTSDLASIDEDQERALKALGNVIYIETGEENAKAAMSTGKIKNFRRYYKAQSALFSRIADMTIRSGDPKEVAWKIQDQLT